MKSKILYMAIVAFLAMPSLALATNNSELNGAHTKEKTIKKEFTVNSNATLKVDNSYGNVNVVTYNGNKTVIEVTIKTNSNNEEKAREKLDEITVEFNASSDYVSAKTIFNKNNSKSWWNNWGNKK